MRHVVTRAQYVGSQHRMMLWRDGHAHRTCLLSCSPSFAVCSALTGSLRTAPVYIALDEGAADVRAGMYARARIQAPAGQSMMLPAESVLVKSGKKFIVYVKGANDRLTPDDVEAASEAIRRADFLVLQLEIPVETVYYALDFARRHGVRTILNPAPGQLDPVRVAAADYVIPNETEAEALTGVPVRDLDGARAAAHRLVESGVGRAIVTLGASGALCASEKGMRIVPPFPVNAVDTTGAGDAFIGSLAVFLAEGHEETSAISRANLYAALSTTVPGTMKSFPSRERFESEWRVRGGEPA